MIISLEKLKDNLALASEIMDSIFIYPTDTIYGMGLMQKILMQLKK